MSKKKSIKKNIVKSLETIGDLTYLLKKIAFFSFRRKIYYNYLADQIIFVGSQSLSITIVIGLTMGLVMTLNFGYGLAKFGGVLYVPAVVSLSLVREMAPIFTSLLVAGRVGSGIAAELGAMNVSQQIDAIRALGNSPYQTLVVPRFWACVISLPLLTTLSDALGIIGGLLVCVSEFDMPMGLYLNKVFFTIKYQDFLSGLIKSSIFGGLMCVLACYKGLTTKDGTRGVGQSTTWVVVRSSISILILDYFLSKIFLVIWVH